MGTKAIYWWCPDGVLARRVPTSFPTCAHLVVGAARAAGDTRNWRTVTRLVNLSRCGSNSGCGDVPGTALPSRVRFSATQLSPPWARKRSAMMVWSPDEQTDGRAEATTRKDHSHGSERIS